jgi:putative phosphoesterase
MTIKAGVLSDTHLPVPDREFVRLAERCFSDCQVIIHAGDLTGAGVLDVFAGKEVHAVHGNMCDLGPCRKLPRETAFRLGPFTVGLTHGAQLGMNMELGLQALFPEADCIIFGHTHRPVCYRRDGILFLNPGSFRGSRGTYAVLEAGEKLVCTLHEVPAAP